MFNQRRRLAIAAAAALAVGVGYHVVFGHNGLTVFEAKRRETQTLEREMKRLTHENESLAEQVDRLKTDPGAIEHQAREELHYTRPGEVIVTLPIERADRPAGEHSLGDAAPSSGANASEAEPNAVAR